MKNYEEIVDAKLVAYTQMDPEYGVPLADAQELIAYCAKVSNPDSQTQADMENSERLIKFLMKHSHWSPLEMVNAVLRINTTRDIGRQLIRHPTFRFQEFSQRYAAALTGDDQGIQLVKSEARKQDHKNRQNSIALGESIGDQELRKWWNDIQEVVACTTEVFYQKAIDKGLAKETARKILPEGMTTTTMFVNGTIRSWVHYADLRLGNGTQKEHVLIAKAAAEAITKIFPMMEEL